MDDAAVIELTFGSHEDLATLAGKVGRALGVTFELRDSLYRGGDYYGSESGRGEFVVQLNEDLDELAVPDRSDVRSVRDCSRFG